MTLAEKVYQDLVTQMEKVLTDAVLAASFQFPPDYIAMKEAYARFNAGLQHAKEIKEFLAAQKDNGG